MEDRGLEYVEKVAQDIREMRIRGATWISVAAAQAFFRYAYNNFENKKGIERAYRILLSSRPNEPLMQNILNFLLTSKNKVDLRRRWLACIEYISYAYRRIALLGAQLIDDDMTIATICHSTMVELAIKKAWERGKKFKVICMETRPRFQGRILARRLAAAGVDVTLLPDGLLWYAADQCDIVLVGADALLVGGIINKIGTRSLAELAWIRGKDVFVLAPTLKFRTQSFYRFYEDIEERSPDEVWRDRPEGVKIYNPAFDYIPKRYLAGIVTEVGIFPYDAFVSMVLSKHPHDLIIRYGDVFGLEKK